MDERSHTGGTRRRWLVYVLVGGVFGVIDFYYQTLVSGSSGVLRMVLVLGVWLIPVVPIILHEARVSRSSLQSALAGSLTWMAAVVAYYLANALQLALWGVPGRPEMHISNRAAPFFWENWQSVLVYDILGGMAEWAAVAIVGGAIGGLLLSALYLHLANARL